VYCFLEQINGNGPESTSGTSSGEPTPPDRLAPPTHQRLVASASAPLQNLHEIGGRSHKTDFYSNIQGSTSNTASPTRCILNNHKMEERKKYEIFFLLFFELCKCFHSFVSFPKRGFFKKQTLAHLLTRHFSDF
jgi:hypothetical protein